MSVANRSTLDHIGRHCLRAFTGSVEASVGVFYRIDADLEPRDFQLYGMPAPMHRAYLSRYREFDPLKPRACLATGRAVVPLRLGESRQAAARNRSYHAFLHRHEIVDVAEVLALGNDGRPLAGLSLLRRPALGAFGAGELERLTALQGLMQIAVAALPQEPGAGSPDAGLTERETQIAALLRDGFSNKALARELGIGLPTVKTHLIHLYRKLGVANRTQLVAKLFL